jgi:hypothetical protein
LTPASIPLLYFQLFTFPSAVLPSFETLTDAYGFNQSLKSKFVIQHPTFLSVYLVSEKSSVITNSEQTDINVSDNCSFHSDINNISTTIIQQEKTSHLSSTSAMISKPKQISYASTDEDVDELNSHYYEEIDRSITTCENSREKFNPHISLTNNENNIDPKRLSIDYSQMTIDSGIDIITEQKLYQPNIPVTIDEQSSKDATNLNDLFISFDDSSIDIEPKSLTNTLLLSNQFLIDNSEITMSINTTEQDTYFSARSEFNNEKDLYSGYELESITDEDDDYPSKDDSNEFIFISESSPPAASHPSPSLIPPQFEFKLPSFGEWINRAFNTFLSETDKNPPELIPSRRSSSDVSIHGSQSTINTTSSSSQVITVLENQNLQNTSDDENIALYQTQSSSRNEEQDDDHSLNGKS